MIKLVKICIIVIIILIVTMITACNATANQTPTDESHQAKDINIEQNNLSTTPIITPNTNSSNESKNNKFIEKTSEVDKRDLDMSEFEVEYKSVKINQDSTIEDIIKALGVPDDYQANNRGYISGNGGYRRWNLCYPNYDNPEIRIIVLSELKYVGDIVEDGESYIVGVYLESVKTQKGLKVGDKLEDVLSLYGKPKIEGENILLYSKDSYNIEIALDKGQEKVESIFLDYCMEKSIGDQDSYKNQ